MGEANLLSHGTAPLGLAEELPAHRLYSAGDALDGHRKSVNSRLNHPAKILIPDTRDMRGSRLPYTVCIFLAKLESRH